MMTPIMASPGRAAALMGQLAKQPLNERLTPAAARSCLTVGKGRRTDSTSPFAPVFSCPLAARRSYWRQLYRCHAAGDAIEVSQMQCGAHVGGALQASRQYLSCLPRPLAGAAGAWATRERGVRFRRAFCPNQHGYWLDKDEDTRVLELMRTEEQHLQNKLVAEDKWSTMLRHMRSGSFLGKLRDLFR